MQMMPRSGGYGGVRKHVAELTFTEYVPPTQAQINEWEWRPKSPFLESESAHPWLWRLIGGLVVRWKYYEESHQMRYSAAEKRDVWPNSSWWWRNVTSRFSKMATRHDYFWTFMCPHCSYDCDWVLDDMSTWNRGGFYRTTNGGTYFTGEYTCHWFEGIVTCPRCMKEWGYGDSD